MGSRFHPRLASWFEEGLAAGRLQVPNGRHIVLNQFPRLLKETRLAASAQVDAESLREFLLAINPKVETVQDGSPDGLKRRLASESAMLPGLRKVMIPVLPFQRDECWFVYTPPLAVMRESWQRLKTTTGAG